MFILTSLGGYLIDISKFESMPNEDILLSSAKISFYKPYYLRDLAFG
jgi:hypothetical protein